ncbi:hypothetical protein, partial [Pseudomonas sp. LAMO17WK12:I10]|uniref:hypothetical protein n=1 Tax=Pseudomonas sp. LAMO17WK12:I10 TaxID=1286371 RepID=UPI001EFDF207
MPLKVTPAAASASEMVLSVATVEIVGSTGAVSTIKVNVAELAEVLPAASLWRTTTLLGPSPVTMK